MEADYEKTWCFALVDALIIFVEHHSISNNLNYGAMTLKKLQGFLPIYPLKVEGVGGRERGMGKERLRDCFGFLWLDKTLWKVIVKQGLWTRMSRLCAERKELPPIGLLLDTKER